MKILNNEDLFNAVLSYDKSSLIKMTGKKNKTERKMKIASSDTKEGLIKLINQYYYTTNCTITEANQVVQLNKTLGRVEEKGKRFNYVV